MVQINGGSQIKSGTITNAQLASSAGITDGQLASSYLYANGTRALTGGLQGGGFEATNFGTPASSSSLATKGYVDGIAQGLANKYSAHAATVTETLTIASGSVTTITGTTVDGVSVATNDYVLIANAPASTGAAGGSTLSSQPANGLYQVTAVSGNISVSRAADMSGANSPFGSYCFVVAGSTWGAAGFVVTTPSTPAAFTYGTGNIGWVQFSGAGEITTDTTLVKSGSQLSRAAITGDISISSGSNTSAIGANKVTLGMHATLAANSVIGNSTGSTATPTAVAMAAAATASAIALRDGNANLVANSIIENIQTIATAAGTTTLVVGSPALTQFTGSTTQTCVLPNATTMANGQSFTVTNRSTGVVTVNMNGGSTLQTMAASSQCVFTLISNGTTAGTWDVAYSITNAGSGGGSVTSASVVSANGFNGSVATATTTPAITITTTVTGMLKGNGTAISAATAGTDYMAPSDFVTNETPSGTVGSGNTSFTLANTPLTGTVMLFQNGLLLVYTTDYTVSGTTISFVTAPLSGDTLRACYQK